jgi:hypothetical protein
MLRGLQPQYTLVFYEGIIRKIFLQYNIA